MDFSKTFDKFSCGMMNQQIKEDGIHRDLVDWIKNEFGHWRG